MKILRESVKLCKLKGNPPVPHCPAYSAVSTSEPEASPHCEHVLGCPDPPYSGCKGIADPPLVTPLEAITEAIHLLCNAWATSVRLVAVNPKFRRLFIALTEVVWVHVHRDVKPGGIWWFHVARSRLRCILSTFKQNGPDEGSHLPDRCSSKCSELWCSRGSLFQGVHCLVL